MSDVIPDEDVLRLFGIRLIQLRKARGWSQERLAHESDMARSYIGGIERGHRNLALVNICKLARTLKVPPIALLDFTEIVRDGLMPNGSPIDPKLIGVASSFMTLGLDP